MRPLRRSWRPEWVHGLLALTLAVLGTLGGMWLFRLSWTVLPVSLCWLLALNVLTFAYYGYDKRCAVKVGRRVPEVILHGLSFLGGSPGAYAAMRTFRHKTIKGRFRFIFWGIVVLQVLLIGWLSWQHWHSLA
jgi:uncharacterized membrane protein YsdA (DUF1294 family)